MGEHQPADNVADRVDVRFGRVHPAVDLDEPALEFDRQLLEPEVFRVRRAAGSDQQLLNAQFFSRAALGPDAECYALKVDLDRLRVEASLCHHLDAAPAEATLQGRAGVLVLQRDDAGQVFQQRHGHAEVVIEGSELRTDRSRADDGDRFGQFCLGGDVVRGDDPAAVGDQPRQTLDPTAGGDDHVLRSHDAVAARGSSVGADTGNADRRRAI